MYSVCVAILVFCATDKLLGIFENILGFNPQISTTLVSKTNIFPWLLNRVQTKPHDDNRGYAAEIVSILLQDHRENRLVLGERDGVETLLKVLSVSPEISHIEFTRLKLGQAISS
jgi:hypothetical protein